MRGQMTCQVGRAPDNMGEQLQGPLMKWTFSNSRKDVLFVDIHVV
jgi:hypothetical protein